MAVSVDGRTASEALRRDLDLPFPILCDTDRRVVQEWDLYNPLEKGGIAKPAVFIIERDRTVSYVTIDKVAARVPASEILLVLRSKQGDHQARRRTYIPQPADWFRGLRNLLRR